MYYADRLSVLGLPATHTYEIRNAVKYFCGEVDEVGRYGGWAHETTQNNADKKMGQ